MEGQHKPVRGGKQGMEGKTGAQTVGERKGWGDRCAEGYVGQHRNVLASQAT